MNLDHFVLLFTRVFIGVSGVILVNIAGICRMLVMTFSWWVYSVDPMDVILWCMHNIWIAWLYVLGSIRNYGGIVGSSYMRVLALKCVMTCESRKGPSWGLRLW